MDSEVEAVFEQVRRGEGRLDVLVNNAFASPEQRVLWSGVPFWELPVERWDDIIDVGLRSHFVAARFAVPMMIEGGGGPIVNVASHAAGSAATGKSKAILP
jgi:NAD(P)-dependent dehydrogenase (short-subunit alcohol dehydrogenase family)